MKIRFKKLNKDAVLPSYAKPGDAGMDITCTSDGKMVGSDDNKDLWYYVEYKTGLAVEVPEGHVGLLFPRSSIGKTALSLANAVGVCDSGYRGEICFRFKVDAGTVQQADNNLADISVYKKGDRIGQIVIIPYPTIEPEFVEELSDTDRGTSGFGSTDIKKENV